MWSRTETNVEKKYIFVFKKLRSWLLSLYSQEEACRFRVGIQSWMVNFQYVKFWALISRKRPSIIEKEGHILFFHVNVVDDNNVMTYSIIEF